MIQQITINVTIPDGYEATGEYRTVKYGDIYLSEIHSPPEVLPWHDDAGGRRIILRKKWAFPEWFKKGWYLRRNAQADRWYAVEQCFSLGDVFDAIDLWAFHGETFTPPSVQSIQKV